MLTRRTFLRLVGCGAGVALLAACGPATPSAAPTAAQTAPAGQTTPKAGGTIKLGSTTELPNLESHQMSPPTFNIVY